MNPEVEAQRLRELLPASGRMNTQICPARKGRLVIEVPFPRPWQVSNRKIYINYATWSQLSLGQRDLLLLRTVSWLTQIRWFRADWYQGLAAVAAGSLVFELVQQDAVGMIVAGGLGAIALRQLWQDFRSPAREIDADSEAIRIAQRRGYDLTDAVEHLLSAIQLLPQLEGRGTLSYVELLRVQNLKAQRNLGAATLA